MKKIIIRSIAVIMAIVLCFPVTIYADENIDDDWQDVILSAAQVEEILAMGNGADLSQEKANNLISSYALGISKSLNTIYLAAKTFGTSEVVKAGFTEVVVQRRRTSTSSWVDYRKYEDIYYDTFSCVVTKTLTVPTGYQYRATCIHYAKKNFFTIQKINNTSNVLTIA